MPLSSRPASPLGRSWLDSIHNIIVLVPFLFLSVLMYFSPTSVFRCPGKNVVDIFFISCDNIDLAFKLWTLCIFVLIYTMLHCDVNHVALLWKCIIIPTHYNRQRNIHTYKMVRSHIKLNSLYHDINYRMV